MKDDKNLAETKLTLEITESKGTAMKATTKWVVIAVLAILNFMSPSTASAQGKPSVSLEADAGTYRATFTVYNGIHVVYSDLSIEMRVTNMGNGELSITLLPLNNQSPHERVETIHLGADGSFDIPGVRTPRYERMKFSPDGTKLTGHFVTGHGNLKKVDTPVTFIKVNSSN